MLLLSVSSIILRSTETFLPCLHLKNCIFSNQYIFFNWHTYMSPSFIRPYIFLDWLFPRCSNTRKKSKSSNKIVLNSVQIRISANVYRRCWFYSELCMYSSPLYRYIFIILLQNRTLQQIAPTTGCTGLNSHKTYTLDADFTPRACTVTSWFYHNKKILLFVQFFSIVTAFKIHNNPKITTADKAQCFCVILRKTNSTTGIHHFWTDLLQLILQILSYVVHNSSCKIFPKENKLFVYETKHLHYEQQISYIKYHISQLLLFNKTNDQ